jgi:hypothetical protein
MSRGRAGCRFYWLPGSVSPTEPGNPPGPGRRGSLTPADPNPSGKSPQPKLFARRVRHTLHRWQTGSRCAHTALPNAPTPSASPP